MHEYKWIRVDKEVYDRIKKHGILGEHYNDVIKKMVDLYEYYKEDK